MFSKTSDLIISAYESDIVGLRMLRTGVGQKINLLGV